MHDYEFAVAPAPRRLPAREAGDLPGLGAARAAEAIRRRAGEAVPVPGAQGGVLPRRLRGRPRRARAGWASTPSASWSSCARRRTSRSITASRIRCSRRCSRGSGSDPGVHAVVLPRTEEQRDLRQEPRPALADRPGPRGRGAEPGRPRRPGRLGRGDDEPRGGGAGHARLHDLRRPARRRRRGADPLEPAASADRPARARAGEEERPGRADPPGPGAAGRSDARARPEAGWRTQTEPPTHFARSPSSPRRAYSATSEVYAPRRVDVALRGLDLLIAGSRAVVLSPLLGLLALATLLTSGRPVLYRGQRVGRAGQHLHDVQAADAAAGGRESARAPSTARSSAAAPSRR